MQTSYTTERIQFLRQAMLVRPSVCVERARLITESYRQTEGEPAVIRRARAFSHLLKNMSIHIYPRELIVGRPTSKVRGGSISPELQCDWILDELDLLSTRDIDPFEPLTDEEKAVLRDVVPYWQTRSLRHLWSQEISPEARQYDDLLIGGGAFCGNNQYPGHSSPDYGQILQYGTSGLIRKIQARIEQGGSYRQLDELRAMLLCLRALETFGDRYADLAAQMAQTEPDRERQTELMQIAATCRKVPREPAESFREAVQSVWFSYVCVMLENWGTGNTFLRVDQYLYPYYLQSRAAGESDQALFEYAASLLINCNSACVVYSEARSHGFAGNNSGCSFTIGGVKRDGSSAVNELSYLFLEAERAVNMGSDDLVIRIDADTDDEFVRSACEVARDVGGKLKFLGDKTTIQNLMLDGMSEAQARDYALAGCTSPVVGGENYNIPGGIISLPGIFELVITNGVHRLTGLPLGVKTGDFCAFRSIEEIWEAFCTQVRHVIPYCHEIKNLDKAIFSRCMPSPFQSSLLPPCVEGATDVIDGGTAPHFCFAMSLAGAPNVGDSMAAIQKWVFEKKALTLAQLEQALNADFEGYDDIRSLLLRAPKFGNDDPYVDVYVNRVLSFVSDTVAQTPGFRAAKSTVAAAAVTANIGLGMVCGALPDGRRAGEPISEGGISPSQGRNGSGMTSTMMSVARLDHSKLRHGEVLNMRISPTAVNTPPRLHKFCDLIRAYMDMGGFLVQFNIVSTQTLRDAQLHPERHRDLVVRVATYAAYFIELGPEMQNDIIRRIEFQEC